MMGDRLKNTDLQFIIILNYDFCLSVFHNMYTKYHRTSIFIHKKQKGGFMN